MLYSTLNLRILLLSSAKKKILGWGRGRERIMHRNGRTSVWDSRPYAFFEPSGQFMSSDLPTKLYPASGARLHPVGGDQGATT